MSRVIRSAELHEAPIDIPAPPAWDSVALAAFEMGYQQGVTAGRLDVGAVESTLADACQCCVDAVDRATATMVARTLEVAELFVTTVLRHVPEARTAGMLVRLGEVLAAFETDPLEVSVAPSDVTEVAAVMAARPQLAARVNVVGDPQLAEGEFRIHSEWADADGTFDRYLAAARDALERMLPGEHR